MANVLEVRCVVAKDPVDGKHEIRVDLRVNGQSLFDLRDGGLSIDLAELARSVDHDGDYQMLTCSCGIAGCAGIKEGIRVRHNAKCVRWSVRTFQPARILVFDRSHYRNAILRGVLEGRKVEAQLRGMNIDFVPSQIAGQLESAPLKEQAKTLKKGQGRTRSTR